MMSFLFDNDVSTLSQLICCNYIANYVIKLVVFGT